MKDERRRCKKCGVEQLLEAGFYRSGANTFRHECITCLKTRTRRWALANPERAKAGHDPAKARARAIRHYWGNREQKIGYARAYESARREAGKTDADLARRLRESERRRGRKYLLTHREQNRELARRYAAANPEKRRLTEARRRTRKRGGTIEIVTTEDWRQIVESFCGRCAYCLRPAARLTQDHVIPLSKGGAHAVGNIVPACRPCNSRKGNRSIFTML